MDARFRSNLAMIGRNEPITKKAKFWQSYVRALKGTDDMRAPENTHRPRGIFRSDYPELHSSSWPYGKSIFENPLHAADRINVPGYRYLPVHREIYGYSPRQLYPHQYKPVERFNPGDFPGKWRYLRQLTESSDLKQQQIIRKWANRERALFGDIMKIRCLKNTRAYPELWGNAEAFAAAAHPPFFSIIRHEPPKSFATVLNETLGLRDGNIEKKDGGKGGLGHTRFAKNSQPDIVTRFCPKEPYDSTKAWNDHLDRLADIDRLYPSPEPLLSRHRSPAFTKPLFDLHGNILDDLSPTRWPSFLSRKTLNDMLEPTPTAPVSAFTRDPWWYPCMAPYIPSYAQWSTPFYLRDSYLSPVKRNYLWSRHPLRPFGKNYVYYSQPVPRFHFTKPWYNY